MSERPSTAYARNGDVHIGYQITGIGPLDIVITSFGTISIDAFDREPHLARFLERLGRFARVIRYDKRGVGLSDPISRDSPPTLEQGVSDLVAVLDAASSQGAALFATMDSGQLFSVAAATHPERMTALVLCNTWARMAWAPDYTWGHQQDFLDSFLARVVEVHDEDEGAELSFLAPSIATVPDFRRWWIEEGRRGASPATAKALNSRDVYLDVRDILSSIRVPTLVMHSVDNRWAPVNHGTYLAEHIEGASFTKLDGSDQYPFAELADQVLGEVEEFLVGVRSVEEPDRVLSTILFTDIVASTEHLSRVGDSGWTGLLDRHDEMARRQIQRFGGREIKTTGDGMMATFEGPARAVRCAMAMRDGAIQLGLAIRAGVHTGEVELRKNDISGIAVHIAQRVTILAEPGQILTTSTVRDLALGSSLEFSDGESHQLKGVPGDWSLHNVIS